jgi:hypothetical protein
MKSWVLTASFQISIVELIYFLEERRECGCPATSIDARNVIRNLLSYSASVSTMLGRENAQNVAGKNWNNLLQLFR